MSKSSKPHPTPAELDKFVEKAKALHAQMCTWGITLSKDERRRAVNFRPGGDTVVELVGRIADQEEVVVPGRTTDDMRESLDVAKRLRPAIGIVSGILQTLEDTARLASSDCWKTTTKYYTTLGRAAKDAPDLEGALKPAVEFFATKKSKPIAR